MLDNANKLTSIFRPLGVGCMAANIFSRLRLILKENVGGGEN